MSMEGIKEFIVVRDDQNDTEVVVSDAGAQGPRGEAGSTVYWDDVLSKPTEFPSLAHTHDWLEVSSKPTAYPAEAHTHSYSQLTGSAAYIDLDTVVGVPVHQEGRIFYDPVNKCPSYYSDIIGSSLQIGQEQWVRVRNNTGATIPDGVAVKIVGSQGQTPTIQKASATTDSNFDVLGITTSTIVDNGIGLVTTFGIVHGLDTSGWNEGDTLYLSSTVAGGLTTIKPLAPNNPVAMGTVVYSQSNNGKVFVRVLAAGVNDDQIIVDAETYNVNGVLSTSDTSMHLVLDKLNKLITFGTTAPVGAPLANQRLYIKTTDPTQLYVAVGANWVTL